MKGVSWHTFPKPHRDLEKCQRWLKACGRPEFIEKCVNSWTYICSKHFYGNYGHTEAHPDPIPVDKILNLKVHAVISPRMQQKGALRDWSVV